ncbi:MAG: hypothetical protein ACLFRP_00075 [Puniceicoccaceae bacterium]
MRRDTTKLVRATAPRPPVERPRRLFFRGGFGLTLMLALGPAGTLLSAPPVLREERRIEFIETLREMLSYDRPGEEELRLLPDPFAFGREIEAEQNEPIVEGVTDEELLAWVAGILRPNIIGHQNFNDRSFIATKDFGLLRDGDTVTLDMPDDPDVSVTVRIVNPDRNGFTIQLEDLELFISVNSTRQGVQPSRP